MHATPLYAEYNAVPALHGMFCYFVERTWLFLQINLSLSNIQPLKGNWIDIPRWNGISVPTCVLSLGQIKRQWLQFQTTGYLMSENWFPGYQAITFLRENSTSLLLFRNQGGGTLWYKCKHVFHIKCSLYVYMVFNYDWIWLFKHRIYFFWKYDCTFKERCASLIKLYILLTLHMFSKKKSAVHSISWQTLLQMHTKFIENLKLYIKYNFIVNNFEERTILKIWSGKVGFSKMIWIWRKSWFFKWLRYYNFKY